MVKNLAAKGSFKGPLIIHNRTQSRATALAATLNTPVTIAPTIASAVTDASIIFICLGDDDAVLKSLADPSLQDVDLRGKLFVDCTTVHPDTSRKEASLLASRGALFAACPVFGAPPVADAGQLICVLSGEKEAVNRAMPFCSGVVGRANIDLTSTTGETSDNTRNDPGRAAMLKVLGNTFVLRMVDSLAEGMVVAEKTGLGVDSLHDLVELLFPGPYVGYSNRMRSGDYYKREEPWFAVDLARKDARHAMSMAADVGVRMKGVERGDEYLRALRDYKGQAGDIAGIYGVVRQESGLKFEND